VKSSMVVACASAFLLSLASAAPSPYQGQTQRDIKALSAQDAQALLDGKGMGLAKAAELNGYPGPAHVLQHAEALKLSPQQLEQTKALFRAMEAKAQGLGAALVEAERELDQMFARRVATLEGIESQLSKMGHLQAQLRSAHLEAHIAQAALLQPQQVAEYNKLQGYLAVDGPDKKAPAHRH
jgi:Spy/CpxP family protein refolding chaperone